MGTSERQLFRARFAWLCKWLLSDVCGGGRFIVKVVCLPEPLLDRLPVERVSGDLADFTRPLVRDAALLLVLLLLSKLDLLSVATRRIETAGSRNRTAVSPHSPDSNPSWLVDATEHAWR